MLRSRSAWWSLSTHRRNWSNWFSAWSLLLRRSRASCWRHCTWHRLALCCLSTGGGHLRNWWWRLWWLTWSRSSTWNRRRWWRGSRLSARNLCNLLRGQSWWQRRWRRWRNWCCSGDRRMFCGDGPGIQFGFFHTEIFEDLVHIFIIELYSIGASTGSSSTSWWWNTSTWKRRLTTWFWRHRLSAAWTTAHRHFSWNHRSARSSRRRRWSSSCWSWWRWWCRWWWRRSSRSWLCCLSTINWSDSRISRR